jgi:hypothetical protein
VGGARGLAPVVAKPGKVQVQWTWGSARRSDRIFLRSYVVESSEYHAYAASVPGNQTGRGQSVGAPGGSVLLIVACARLAVDA